MTIEYRGHFICLSEAEPPFAELVEQASGTRLPTKVIGEPDESLRDLAQRAQRLVDLYLGDESSEGQPS